MRILLLGSKGMLGSDCKTVLSNEFEVIAPDKRELDIIRWDVVIEKMQEIEPDIVLNCAAFTDVDACEKEHFAVRKINVEGPRNLAQGCARFNCKLIHISSDYVFSGQKTIPQPYFEDDPMTPISAYGKSKMESEVAVRENVGNYIIIRSAWLYGFHGENFVTSIIRQAMADKKQPLSVVNDQYGSPTWTHRLALQIREFVKSDVRGTYHATSEGYCTRYEYARRILEQLKIKRSVVACSLKDIAEGARRPSNCILENRLLKKMNLSIMPDWQKDLDTFLEAYGKEYIKQAKAGKL